MKGNTRRRRASRRASDGDLRRRARPPRMSRAELLKRARMIADRWKEEQEQPLSRRDISIILTSLCVEAARAHRDEIAHWGWRTGHAVCCEVLRRLWPHIPAAVQIALAGAGLEEMTYAWSGDRPAA